MSHPLIEEFCRAHQFDPSFLRQCQRVFREEVQTQLDERDRLLVENAELRAKLVETPERGRLRKDAPAAVPA